MFNIKKKFKFLVEVDSEIQVGIVEISPISLVFHTGELEMIWADDEENMIRDKLLSWCGLEKVFKIKDLTSNSILELHATPIDLLTCTRNTSDQSIATLTLKLKITNLILS